MPIKELERLAAVNRFLKLEISKEKEIQEIVALAAKICGTPTALITLVADDTQYVKFKIGSDLETTTRQAAFCSHTIGQQDVLMIRDALLDERFADNPLVTGGPGIRFYAGAPLTTQDGFNLGSLCVIDQAPGKLSSHQQEMLQVLSKQVIHLLEFDTSLQILKEQYVKAKNSEIKLRSFFESSSSCHLLIGKDMEVMAFNKALADFVIKHHEVKISTGMRVTDYVHPSYVNEFIRNYKTALAGTPVVLERKIQYGDEYIWWYFTYDPARNPDGEIIGVSYNATDITKRVEQEQRVLAQNESLREIAFIQSHELRRPVASIMGLMDLVKADGRAKDIEELQLMEKAVAELDEKIRLVVGYTTNHDSRVSLDNDPA
ncbi:PAS domain S-box-containing protein [Mucilaginibacter pineti]|uniref:histidine kinase n=1 Tax=Mucilaginibacter pineti TaxID=1391627 RepID=A0A1G7NVD7_9SPHI|nr:GAF domain-containing protein [Mucilaginibacter pineti]SDF77941.1 PAS domain S-box-containing protein [Mucilaginibacter pineti]